jgi:tetratricopeptide (TPR) repeat protein
MKLLLLAFCCVPLWLSGQINSRQELEILLSEDRFDEAIAFCEAQLSLKSLDVYFAHELASTYLAKGEIPKAIQIIKSYDFARLGGKSEVLRADIVLATCYSKQGEIARADSIFINCRKRFSFADTSLLPVQIDWLNHFSESKWLAGRPFEAIDVLETGYDSLAQVHRRFKGQGGIVNNLGILNWSVGKYESSLEAFHLAVSFYSDEFGPQNIRLSKVLNNLGVVYYHQGDLKKAAEFYNRSLELRMKLNPDPHPGDVLYHNNMGRIARDLGNFDEADQHFQQAEAILRSLGAFAIPQLTEIVELQAELRGLQHETAEALRLFDQVLAQQRQYDADDNSRLASLFYKRGKILATEGRLVDALADFEEAQRRASSTLSLPHPQLVAYHTAISETLLALNDKPGSMHYAIQALTAGRSSGPKISYDVEEYMHYPELLAAANQLVAVSMAIGAEPDNVIKTIDLAIHLLEYLRSGVRYESRATLATEAESLFSNAISFAIKANNFSLLFEVIERSKSFTLRLSQNEQSLLGQSEELDQLLNAYRDNTVRQNYWESQLADQPKSSEELAKLRAASASLVSTIHANYPLQSALLSPTIPRLADLQREIGERIYLTSFLNDSIAVVMWVERESQNFWVINAEEVSGHAAAFYRALSDRPWILESPEEADEAFVEAGSWLYKNLIEPGLVSKPRKRELMVNADGLLQLFPWGVLPVEIPDTRPVDYRSVVYLSDHADVSSVWTSSMAKGQVAEGEKFGIWFFSSNEGLQSGKHEAHRLQRITGGQLSEGAVCTETSFKNSAGDFDILHIVAHGKRHEADEEFSLYFNDDEANDGYLTIGEIGALRLHAKMTTLSACETGSGEILAGESVYSLASGFAMAGCPAVVMSNWKVSDQATSNLMVDFYRGLFKGLSKSASLGQAQRKYLNEQEDALLCHPYFWASFTVVGDASPIRSGGNFWIWVWSVVGLSMALLILHFILRKSHK